MARKTLSQAEKKARDILRRGAISYAVSRRKQGANYVEIEKELKDQGVVDHCGTPFHNAFLSKGVVQLFPDMRVKSPHKIKKVKKTSKRQNSWANSADVLSKLLKGFK